MLGKYLSKLDYIGSPVNPFDVDIEIIQNATKNLERLAGLIIKPMKAL
jgi:hypothetical protein